MFDILTFNTFISSKVLIIFYYLFSFLIPISMLYAKNYFYGNMSFLNNLKGKQKWKVYVSFFLLFIFMELFLRMFFEAMIGYFDMHNYLYEMVNRKV